MEMKQKPALKRRAPFSLHLPEELQKHLQVAARSGYRSLTGEIVMRLERDIAAQAELRPAQ